MTLNAVPFEEVESQEPLNDSEKHMRNAMESANIAIDYIWQASIEAEEAGLLNECDMHQLEAAVDLITLWVSGVGRNCVYKREEE
jgi:hypothetical protein